MTVKPIKIFFPPDIDPPPCLGKGLVIQPLAFETRWYCAFRKPLVYSFPKVVQHQLPECLCVSVALLDQTAACLYLLLKGRKFIFSSLWLRLIVLFFLKRIFHPE